MTHDELVEALDAIAARARAGARNVVEGRAVNGLGTLQAIADQAADTARWAREDAGQVERISPAVARAV